MTLPVLCFSRQVVKTDCVEMLIPNEHNEERNQNC